MKKNNNFSISKMYCCKCGKEGISIPRKAGHYRKSGHLKKIYCIHCKTEWNHVEIQSLSNDYGYEDFELEQEYNNFDNYGNRKEPYKTFKHKLLKGDIIKL